MARQTSENFWKDDKYSVCHKLEAQFNDWFERLKENKALVIKGEEKAETELRKTMSSVRNTLSDQLKSHRDYRTISFRYIDKRDKPLDVRTVLTGIENNMTVWLEAINNVRNGDMENEWREYFALMMKDSIELLDGYKAADIDFKKNDQEHCGMPAEEESRPDQANQTRSELASADVRNRNVESNEHKKTNENNKTSDIMEHSSSKTQPAQNNLQTPEIGNVGSRTGVKSNDTESTAASETEKVNDHRQGEQNEFIPLTDKNTSPTSASFLGKSKLDVDARQKCNAVSCSLSDYRVREIQDVRAKDERQKENQYRNKGPKSALDDNGKRAKCSSEDKSQIEKLEQEVKSLQSLIQSHENENAELQESKQKADKEIESLEKSNSELESEKRRISDKANFFELKNTELVERLKETELEKDQLLVRFSKIAAEKLTSGNPNIADLSDPNRPTKLGEIYSQLYDNEWTDALESLTQSGYEESEAIATLLDTLLHVFDYCNMKSTAVLKEMTAAVNLLFKDEDKFNTHKSKTMSGVPRAKQAGQQTTMPQFDRETSTFFELKLLSRWRVKKGTQADSSTQEYTSMAVEAVDVGNKLNKLQKEVAVAMVPVIQKAYLKHMWGRECIAAVKVYIKKCLFLSWMMIVQDPPLAFYMEKPNAHFRTEIFKAYLKSGPYIDYVVWPALLLHAKGPVLCKGVAAGKKHSKI